MRSSWAGASRRSPQRLSDAARERDLPLIALHNIVPFVEITEEIQRRIVFGQAGELSAHHELQAVLNAALLRAEGLTGIVRALAQALGCEVVLRTVSGRVVATTALERVSGEYASAAVSVLGEEWGTLRVYAAPESSAAKVRAAARARADRDRASRSCAPAAPSRCASA